MLTSTYCIIYLGLEDESPSLFIVLSIANAGEKGLDRDALAHLITDDIFIKPRLEYLIEEKMAYKDGGRYFLSQKGYNLLRICSCIQKLMKLPQQAG